MHRIEYSAFPYARFEAMDALSEQNALRSKRLEELRLELQQLGDTTPPPHNYRYDLVDYTKIPFTNRWGYRIHSQDKRNWSYIPGRIAAFYSSEEREEHDTMIKCLDRYFEIKRQIHDLENELDVVNIHEQVERLSI